MDTIIRMIAKDAPIKAMAIQAKGIVERAREIHKTLPVATAALGRTLMAASMMGQQIKEKDGSVTLRINGGGPLGTHSGRRPTATGNVRGYVQNGQVELPRKGTRASWTWAPPWAPDGSLTVIKDLKLKEPYVGTVRRWSPARSPRTSRPILPRASRSPTACALGVLGGHGSVRGCAPAAISSSCCPAPPDEVIDKLEAGIARGGPGDRPC